MTERSILLVEPDVAWREIFAGRLRESHHHIDCAASARDVLRRAPGERHGLMVTELLLPDMGAAEYLKALSSHPVWRDLPIIIFTRSLEKRHAEICLGHSVNAYFVKSEARVEEVLVEIRRHFKKLGNLE